MSTWRSRDDHPSLFATPDDDERAPAPHLLRAGDVVDRFRVGRLLGIGGHGVVYGAEHVELGYPVALKVLEGQAGFDPRRRARFRREALVGARVRHRNIVSIYEAGELGDGTPYIVMEHVDGIELAELLARRTLAPAAVVDLGVQLLAACAALWEHGILHRDIKPQNVMLARAVDGAVEVKLLDFGIVKALRSEEDPTLTQDGFVLGTPHYMSPEQVCGKPLDARSDLYAVGALLYESLAGSPPFDGEYAEGVLTKVLIEDPIPIERRRPECPRELAEVITRALAKQPDARYPTAGAMVEDLRAVWTAAGLPRGNAAWQQAEAALPRAGQPGRQRFALGPAAAPRLRVSSLASPRVSSHYLPTPAERPSILRRRRPQPRLLPPWWPAAAALLVAALLGGFALEFALDVAPQLEKHPVSAPAR